MPSTFIFLDLPLKLREKIYAYCGLLRLCPIELNVPDGVYPQLYDDSGEVTSWQHNECLYTIHKQGSDRHFISPCSCPDCLCPRLPTQLLRVSRSFYNDSFLALYSKNKFILRAQNADGLGLFLRLNKHVLSTINSLLIRLNSWPCIRGHEDASRNGLKCSNCSAAVLNTDYALSITSPVGQDLVMEWKNIMLHLASTIVPGQLRLSFICDVVDVKSGKAILEPLSRLPVLNQCSIRLNRSSNYQLAALARDTSAQTTHSFIRSSQPFPFKRLPRELRLHTLGYTHLGQRNSYHKSHNLLRIKDGKLVKAKLWFMPNGSTCCRHCTETLIDCCCPSTRAAYSATCICQRLPVELFTVDKEMHQDAIAVLLDQNCFEFLQDPDKTVEFLSRFPAGSLEYIRRIQFRFSEKEVRLWTQQNYSRQWLALVTFIKEHFKLPQLSVAVVAETFDLGSLMEGDETRSIYNVYCDITRSLRKISGVGKISFDLGWFSPLGPLMSRAVAGSGHEDLYPELVIRPEYRNLPDARIPHWFKESDFTEDVEFG